MLSINGSPLTNPYELGLDWLAHDSPDGPRASTASLDEDGRPKSRIVIRAEGPGHSRSNSQASNLSGAGGRANSRQGNEAAAAGLFSARVAVPTKDGHMLEFDPLHTSPAALDKLSGITDSAKKQAKEDMARLLQQAVRKWNIDS
ncbi:hypothetical protein PENSPDRAFT_684675 [Peniophora sp. CONT]|nr:hypothetical protein PENSPDRAFT_684675 [Peniophora sp. CONT]